MSTPPERHSCQRNVSRKDPEDTAPARSYQDYAVTVDESALPAGVTCQRMG